MATIVQAFALWVDVKVMEIVERVMVIHGSTEKGLVPAYQDASRGPHRGGESKLAKAFWR